MTKIILPNYTHVLNAVGKKDAQLSFTLIGAEIDLHMRGDPNIIMQMILQGLKENKEIRMVMITAILAYGEELQKEQPTERIYELLHKKSYFDGLNR